MDTRRLTECNTRTGSYKRKYGEEGDEVSIIPSVIGKTGQKSTEVNCKKYDENSLKQKLFRKHCLDWIVMDGVPLNSTEKEGFRQLLHSVDDRLNCPSRSTIKSHLDEQYKHVRNIATFNFSKPAAAGLLL